MSTLQIDFRIHAIPVADANAVIFYGRVANHGKELAVFARPARMRRQVDGWTHIGEVAATQNLFEFQVPTPRDPEGPALTFEQVFDIAIEIRERYMHKTVTVEPAAGEVRATFVP